MSIPRTQRAWLVAAKGTPAQVLRMDDNVPVPTLAKGEVLVQVRAAALNPVAYKIMGMVPGFILKRPYIPEHDLAGIVVDANGSKFKTGDEVFGFLSAPPAFRRPSGTLAQYARVPASALVCRPTNISWTEAAGIPLVAMTAYQALFKIAKLEAGQSVFVNGGSTAVGAFAIQLAKANGCTVAASASGKNEAFVRGLGADEFFDYTKGPLHETLAAANLPKFHVFLEAVGPQPKGFDIGGFWKLVWKVYLQPGWLGGTRRSWRIISVANNGDDLQRVAAYVSEGKIKPIVDSTFAFEDALEAYERMTSGRATGKIVIKVDPNVD
ncbi:uncharacterized protein FIBRA_06102 [Fibroporia radiculosa]|uniref:Enoyl reductase (ER) domain-containing protein n=1 Tax=Fibroporia radiculosa TaxID=599839 RepID=J4H3W4_9APHY|nr:uncharacterized protein FIBRA_06102 [Fibroporia radiculosa]CCM03949.1 predicted protein [Fibroporia radiculosa]